VPGALISTIRRSKARPPSNWRFGGGPVNFGYMVRAEDIACALGSLQIRQYDPLGNLRKAGE
jgi:hypothetical protein